MARPVGSSTGRTPTDGYPAVDDALGGFLAGFLEGEACFIISKQSRGTNHHCTMALCARDDDRDLITGLATATRAGSITFSPAYARSKPQVLWRVPVVHITLRADDRPLLEEICRQVGAGTVYDQNRKNGARSASWMVRDGSGLLKVMDLLDTEGPRGRRQAEYAIWRLAVRDYASELPRLEVRARLSSFRRQLAEARRYKARNGST